MEVTTLVQGVNKFIEQEILPKSNAFEKGIIIGAPILGVFDIQQQVEKALSSKLLATSKIWLDSGKTNISVTLLKQFANAMLAQYGGRYVYEGYAYDLGFKTVMLFQGFVIDEEFVTQLFSCIESANSVI
ncbi:MAG: hypothetical protein R3Y58_01920 [Eubacteriales bacterium]